MYSSIIEIKKNVPSEMLANLRRATERAFSNRTGSVRNSSDNDTKALEIYYPSESWKIAIQTNSIFMPGFI